MADEQIREDDPRTPDVQALLARHLEFALGQTPPEHSFALDPDGLLDPAITLFSYRACGSVLGIGAIKRLGPDHAEIKSMHTAEAARAWRPGPRPRSPRPGRCTRARASSRAARSPATSPARTTCS